MLRGEVGRESMDQVNTPRKTATENIKPENRNRYVVYYKYFALDRIEQVKGFDKLWKAKLFMWWIDIWADQFSYIYWIETDEQ
jgi:hypothetical protein